MGYAFIINSILLGAGLAMDAFSVSCANALREPGMKGSRMSMMAGVYAFFQFLMPMLGWLCVHSIKERFTAVQGWIPWIALGLLVWIGGNMLLDGIRQGRHKDSSRQDEDAKADKTAYMASEKTACVIPEKTDGSESGRSRTAKRDRLPMGTLLLQGIATSIDALSVGFTIAQYRMQMAFTACLIIAAVTFAICMGGLVIGKKAGTKLSGKADLLGGAILIAIGIEIVISHYL